MTEPDIWQEYDCPNQLLDLDLFGADILVVGQSWYCCLCGHEHIATETFPGGTMVVLGDGEMQYRPMPKDAAEKAAWLAEVAAATPSPASPNPPKPAT